MPPRFRRSATGKGHTDMGNDGDSFPSTNAAKTRRPHRKSRNGCNECKRRHIRCDERQPDCTNCEVAQRSCVFPAPKEKKKKQGQNNLLEHVQLPCYYINPPPSSLTLHSEAVGLQHSALSRSHHNHQYHHYDPYCRQCVSSANHEEMQGQMTTMTTTMTTMMAMTTIHFPPGSQTHRYSSSHPAFSIIADETASARYTAQHLFLLHHACTATGFMGADRNIVNIAVRRVADSPYLMDELLALMAFRISFLFPKSASLLQHQALELQTRAVSGFTKLAGSVSNDNKETCVPRFLFSGILSMHFLADTLAHNRSNFHVFIDRFTEYFNLHRGIRGINRETWDVVYESDLSPILNVTRDADKKTKASAHECAALEELMQESDLNVSSVAACRHAITCLQWAFDVSHNLASEYKFHIVSAFSVKLNVEYVEVLRKHHPEALVILAYFAVLLHRSRNYWAFGEAGACIVHEISKHLGSYWQKALKWPLEVIENERD